MLRFTYLLLFLTYSYSSVVYGQELRSLNNYPFATGFINPSYVASSGALELDLNFKKQWYGIEGSPEIGSLLLQIPVSDKLGLGVDLGNDKRGLLNTFRGEGIFAYKVNLGKTPDSNHMLAFGLTFGLSKTSIDIDRIMDPTDPAIANVADNSFSLEGKFGLFYRNKMIDVGFTLPKLFRPNLNSSGFGEISLEPLNFTHSFVKMNLRINDNLRFEPWFNLQTYENYEEPCETVYCHFDPHFEVLGLLHVKDIITIGTSYKVDNGMTFYLGFNINPKVKTSYSYELSNTQVPGFNQGTHEFQVALMLKEKLIEESEAVVEQDPTPPTPFEEEKVKEEPTEVETVVVEEKKPVVVEKKEPVRVPIQKVDTVKTEIPAQKIPEPAKEVVPVEVKTPVVTPAVPSNPLDFTPGHYLVVAVFKSSENAQKYMIQLSTAGYSPKLKQNKETGMYYAILQQSSNLNEMRDLRTKTRSKTSFDFKNAWILSIN